MPERFLVAIPVHNEERYVDAVLNEVRRYAEDILIVDDGSTDGTSEILRGYKDIRVITHPENRGYGQSLADAFRFARSQSYSWLITLDCDAQHEPAYIPQFLAAAASGDAEVISGTRYPGGHDLADGAPAERVEINRIITRLINNRLGLEITDAFCGFKAYCVPSLDHLAITIPGYAMPMQWWVQVARAALRVVEIPVPLIYVDQKRSFGGTLDDPDARLQHYLDVFEAEWARPVVSGGGGVARCAS